MISSNVDGFVNELKLTGKSSNTISAYRSDVVQFKQWIIDTIGTDSDNITQVDIRQYVQYLNINKKQSTSTINRKVKSIVQYCKFLYNSNVISSVVNANELKQKSVDSTGEVRIIDKKDIYKLKRTIYSSDNKRDIAIYELLINTGIRCSELTNIETDDIYITDRNGSSNYSYINIRAGKGNKNRKIPLNSDVVRAIKDYMKHRPNVKDKKLLQGQRGAITRIAINKLLGGYCSDAHIDTVTPHMFRHTCLNTMIKNGIDIKTVASIAGHSSTDITYKYYVNSNGADRCHAVEVLQDNLI